MKRLFLVTDVGDVEPEKIGSLGTELLVVFFVLYAYNLVVLCITWAPAS